MQNDRDGYVCLLTSKGLRDALRGYLAGEGWCGMRWSNRWFRAVLILAVSLVVNLGIWWYGNPIHLHQSARVGGVEMDVPFGWVVTITPSSEDPTAYVGLRRAYFPEPFGRPWVMGTISGDKPRGGAYDMESARKAQDRSASQYADRSYYSTSKVFSLSAGKYQSLCAEGTLPARERVPSVTDATCYVLGTPLMASFMSPKNVDQDAALILSWLK